eukprot:3575646-Amphidinium_carterae.1
MTTWDGLPMMLKLWADTLGFQYFGMTTLDLSRAFLSTKGLCLGRGASSSEGVYLWLHLAQHNSVFKAVHFYVRDVSLYRGLLWTKGLWFVKGRRPCAG